MDMSAMGESEKVTREDSHATYVARFVRHSGWPEVKEAFMAGQVGAAYLLAPLAMDHLFVRLIGAARVGPHQTARSFHV
jgi:hypothetical protein